MDIAEKAYIAGIIDGEGTVTLARKHKNETPSPKVTISNCNLELLKWVHERLVMAVSVARRELKRIIAMRMNSEFSVIKQFHYS